MNKVTLTAGSGTVSYIFGWGVLLLAYITTTIPLYQPVRHDDFCRQQVWILDVVDDLGSGFASELSRVDVDRCQLW